MKLNELLTIVGVHVVTFVVTLVAVMNLKPDMPELALVVAAISGTWTGAFLHHRRQSTLAPPSVKATVGGAMAIICVIEAIVAQSLWHFMSLPEVEITISAVGTFGFPFVLLDTFEKSLQRKG